MFTLTSDRISNPSASGNGFISQDRNLRGRAEGTIAVAVQPARIYAPNTEIFAEGARAKSVYQVAFGAVRVCRILADGRRQISAFHFAGEVFGLEPGAHHEFSAEAITNTGIRVTRLSGNDDVARHLLPIALRGLARAQQHLLLLGRQSALERVAAFLKDMVDRQESFDHIELPMQRSDIGDYLGLTLETVSRTFSRLKEAGVIRLTTSRSVEIVDIDALEAMVG
ncbi:MAG TPA: helix-turn-helix domain-containing protein [Pararhizobium sp.]|uniref:helix-turn-helix domain-containing protein n=1 Tax=Pararhizobium sp. TaxID=1977563 RepID=UPI002BC66D56|nr:helix-turn-helix domain-containing protein [Pararhizobium sp.]HTO33145.1 helix-turn-helix domain-containing protein [Pararhizobium sp.]